jgi:hypothetical protein
MSSGMQYLRSREMPSVRQRGLSDGRGMTGLGGGVVGGEAALLTNSFLI